MSTPVGALVCTAGAIRFDPHRGAAVVSPGWRRDDDAFADIASQLGRWFAGERTTFDTDLDVVGTPFQRRVWGALAEIPYASTATYRDVVGECDGSARAVGAANASNPLSIVIPCHRLVGAGGQLTGYAGGVAAKRWLLDHEAAVMAGRGGLRHRGP